MFDAPFSRLGDGQILAICPDFFPSCRRSPPDGAVFVRAARSRVWRAHDQEPAYSHLGAPGALVLTSFLKLVEWY